jgi:hypothetical protein
MCAVLEKCLLDDILQSRLQGAETGRAELAGARHRVDRFLELQKITEGLHGQILFFDKAWPGEHGKYQGTQLDGLSAGDTFRVEAV